MQDEKFKRALREVMLQDYRDLEVPAEPHVFSEEFETRMERLIRRREKPWYRITNTWSKRIACAVVMVLMVSSVMLLRTDAQGGRYEDFGITTNSEWTTVVPVETDADDPHVIEEEYRITYDLSGYEMEYNCAEADHSIHIEYRKGENDVFFTQNVKWHYNYNHNTEYAMLDRAYVNDREAIYYKDRFGYYNLIWMNEDYIFHIATNIGESAAIEMAESVQKVED